MWYSVQWGSGNPASCRRQRGLEGIRDHLNARLKHTTTKEKWWAEKVQSGDSSQDYANEAMTKMQAEAAEAKVVLIN